ncbi:MAG: ATP-binding protein [Pseudobdellovibrionaceae bacterium]|nr:MAG: ATP-binding protein [Pseudobdellovibrionaceae bacterium]
MMTKRLLFNKIKDLKKSILLLGPRQTGKSTLIKQLRPEIEINLADQQQFLRHLSDPSLIKSMVAGRKTIFVDEVQRIPSLLNTVQYLIDETPGVQFFLTGSSARKLKRGKANLLPGRIVTYELGPLTHQELGDDFEIEKALEVGLLPGLYWEEGRQLAHKILRTYSATYLTEEVQSEALTKNLEGFSRFFQVTSALSGGFLDYAKFASKAMIDRSSARRYFDVLVDTLIFYRIEPFSKSKTTRLTQHPRFYFFDLGALNGSLNNFGVSSDRKVLLFEHLFLQLLLSSAKAHDHVIRTSVYRTEAGAEVDFVIEREDQVFAVEVKASKNVGKSDLTGLKSFASFYGKTHLPMVIYLGSEDYELEGVPIKSLSSGFRTLGY